MMYCIKWAKNWRVADPSYRLPHGGQKRKINEKKN